MKINRSMLTALVMAVGSFSAMGCNKTLSQGAPQEAAATPAQASAAPEAPVAASPAPAPVPVKAVSTGATVATTAPGILSGLNGVRYARPAPPALRIEMPGRAPSDHHVFRRGFWQWDNGRVTYTWVPGSWEDRAVAAPFAPPPPRFEDPGLAPSADYTFVRGYWRYEGHDYRWVAGHWETRRDADDCAPPTYVEAGGRWVIEPAHRDRRPEVKASVTIGIGTRKRG